MKRIGYVSILAFFSILDIANACATCFGDPNSNAAKGMDMAIITLLGVIGPLLFAILIGIISIKRYKQPKNNVKVKI